MPISPESGHHRQRPVSIVPVARHSWVAPLPLPLTSFIGRERERATVHALLLHDGVRLVTLVGPGGIGKTRLALQLAADLSEHFSDGVAWVPLGTVRDVNAVMPTIAHALGIVDSPNNTPLATVKRSLRDARLLLVLDNFEQLLPAGEHVADLLTACPTLAVLITSRSLLHVSGEHVVEVPPLSLPAPYEMPSPEWADRTEAVQLFSLRARAVCPTFVLDERTAPLVVDICCRLDGIPLAIELAAARANHLPLPALRNRLERRLPLLTGGARDQPVRLRAMRDAIAWSYDLLSPEERAVFRHAAAFAGGCRLDAAAAVRGRERSEPTEISALRALPDFHDSPFDMLDAVSALVDHSLLRQVTDADGEPRYIMLETVREFGLEQLAAASESEGARRRHASVYLALAEQAVPHLRSSAEPDWFARLDPEQDNFRLAVAWDDAMNEVETRLRLVVALHVFWHARGHVSEARAWLDRLLAATRSVDVSPLTHVAALTAATWLATTQADFQNAVAYGEAAVGLTRAIRQPAVAARAMMFLGCAYEGEYLARARDCCMQAVTLFRAIDDPEGIAMALGNLGVTLRRLGDFQAAGALFEEQLAREQGRGYIRGARALADLGDLDLDWNDRLAAVTHYRESLALFARAGDVTNIALCTTALGLAIAGVSAYSAARLLGMAASLRKPTGLTAWSFDERRYDRTVADVRTHLGEAAFADAWAAGRASSVDQLIAEVVAVVAHAESKRSPTPEAARFGLTPRELEVLRGLVERLTDREIAARLSLSPRTIGWYVTGILTKLDVSSRRAAAAKASEEVLL